MRPTFPRPARAFTWIALLALAVVASCRDAGSSTTRDAPSPPAAEFVLAAGDSTFWVTSAAGTVHMRGAPLELARVDGRFYELYVADDDRSFQEATFIGQRVYRRDLVRGDSVLVYEDSVVPRLAREYARLHPDDRPLSADDEPSDDPRWSATATLDLVDLHGQFVSFDSHADVERDDAPPWHTSRRGVIDLRGRGDVSLAAVVGSGAPLAEVQRTRTASLRAALAAVRAADRGRDARATALLPSYRLDPAGFVLTTVDGAPAVDYALTGTGTGDAGHLLPLEPIPIGEPAWWPAVAATLPIGSADGGRDTWRHRGYDVVIRYDSTLGAGRLVLRDSTSREWSVGLVPEPAARIFWLDAPVIDSASRRALVRAFEEASLYDEAVRTAAWRPARRRVRLHLAAARSFRRTHFTGARHAAPHA